MVVIFTKITNDNLEFVTEIAVVGSNLAPLVKPDLFGKKIVPS